MQKSKGETTREHVLEKALTLIQTRGFANTSISDIIEATGVKKGNLYFHFSTKEDLVYALIEKARDDYNNYIKNSLKGETARDKIFSIIDAVYRYHRSKNFVGGCLFGNTALEMADSSNRFTELIRSIFEGWINDYARLVHRGQQEGSIPHKLDPRETAQHILASIEGAIMLARLTKDPKDFQRPIQSLKALLSEAV